MSEKKQLYTRINCKIGVISFHRVFLIAFLLLICSPVIGQTDNDLVEISVFTEIPKIGGSEIPAVIDGEDIFLSVTDIFNFIKIRNALSEDAESVSGFFIYPEALYEISRKENVIRYQEKTYPVKDGDLIKSETNLFLKSDYFKLFGLDCRFDFRNLAVIVLTNLELPAIREMKQEEIRKNLNRLKGEITADTTVKRSYPLLRFGMADWSVYSSQEIKGRTDNRLNLNLGGMLAGGEFRASLNYNSLAPFSEKNQNYVWRYADNDNKLFRQVMAGKIAAQPIATLSNNVIGVQVTNTPTTYRRSFGTYTLTDRTEPGWIVELYVNNVLVDYLKADASGFFQFQVPLVYGNSIIQLKYYGPWGEEKTREQIINIPYNFIPEKTIEYKISAGFLEDSLFSRYSKISLNYGLSRRLTIGGGMEYLSSLKNTPFMPYVNASWSAFNNLLLSGEYTYGVRLRGTLSYRTLSNIQVNLDYTRYDEEQEALFYNYLEERKGSVSIPLKIGKFSAFNRLSLNQIVLPSTGTLIEGLKLPPSYYTTGEWTFSTFFNGFNSNISTYAILMGKNDARFYSNISMAVKLPADFILRPQVNYDYTDKKLITARMGAEKTIGKNAFLTASFERSFITGDNMAELAVIYNFSFAQTGISARNTGKRTSLIEYARGSLIYDRKTKYTGFENQFNVGKGAISVIPFLDLNGNGMRDRNEPKADGLNLRVNGGRVEKVDKDTTIMILGLEPYTNCYIDLDENSFDNLTWRVPLKILSVAVDPEIVKHIEIPISVVGEASGNVTIGNNKAGENGGIIVRFFKDNRLAGSTMTEDDGFFSFFGLMPGEYNVLPDTSQLALLGMISSPGSRDFLISPEKNGEVVEDLDFNISRIVSDTLPMAISPPEPVLKRDTTVLIVHEVVEELVTISKDSWAIQLGAFKNRTNAETLRKNLEKLLNRPVNIVIADGYFKVRINEIPERDEVDRIVEKLHDNGFTELWVISLKARQQQVIMREKQDSVIQVITTRVEEPEIFESKIFLPMTESFYKLEKPKAAIVDQTVITIMKNRTGLADVKFKDIRPAVRIVTNDTTNIVIPAEKQPVTVESPIFLRDEIKVDKIKLHYEVPEVRMKSVDEVITENAPEPVKVPVISLQVGIYYKKSEAEKARKKIMSKLNVPVKVVEQWEYYRVIITGFHSREETYQYYPELAGLGFPGPTLIEE
ncbi:MAG TPA: SPOR domain-containing protein [Bacteroidales bacterium]|nr:SPOR domain-containing protein [Bacteroidales bacterium]